MSHSSKIFESGSVQVQNRNGFDLSHLNVGTSKCGQLVPVLCKLLPPNSDFTLGVNMEVNLPPLATTFYGRIDAIIEGFVIPCSILYGGWKQFITNNPITSRVSTQSEFRYDLPYLKITNEDMDTLRPFLSRNDALFDYLNANFVDSGVVESWSLKFNILPFLAYHLIWDVYYRNKQITNTIFAVNPNYKGATLHNRRAVSLIWHSFYTKDNPGFAPEFSFEYDIAFPDGVYIFETRQRNYARDYFTSAVPSPQQGNASTLKFSVSDSEGEFTISALRNANSLQKFLETNNLSEDYADMMRNRWGTRPIDADFDEPYYIGRVIVPVYQKGVYQQDSLGNESAVNPFAKQGAIGVKGAQAGFSGSGKIGKYHNTTWSYVMCLFSLVPHAMYSLSRNREMTMIELGDFPAPEFQSVGYEEIFRSEIRADVVEDEDGEATFGYIPRYSRFKYMDDTVHGELVANKTLESFVLQRYFGPDVTPVLSTDFLEIHQEDLDGIFSVSTANMNLSCWYEIFFEFKVVMPLADFCIPTLGDIQDTHTIKTSIGGSRL